jgi:hypothetical protein
MMHDVELKLLSCIHMLIEANHSVQVETAVILALITNFNFSSRAPAYVETLVAPVLLPYTVTEGFCSLGYSWNLATLKHT